MICDLSYNLAKAPLVCDQWALARICYNDVPCLRIDAEADQTLWALNWAVYDLILLIAASSPFARVEG